MTVKIKRAYDPAEKLDGKRILVDRLWPRGIRKEDASVWTWMKEIAPSIETRKKFAHRPENWNQFREDYARELCENELLKDLRRLADSGLITLLYAAKDESHNNAVVLRDILLNFEEFEKDCRSH